MANLDRSQVFNAADQISATGQNPTVAGIRAKLGTGSYTTITAMLRQWKEQATPSEPEPSDVPPEVQDALARAAQTVWRSAQDHFARELATVKKEHGRLCTAATNQTAEALQEITRLESVLEATVTDNVKLTQALTACQDAHHATINRAAALDAGLAAALARIEEQADLLRRLTTRDTATDTPTTTPKAKPRKTPAKDPTHPPVLPDPAP